jgi:plastocyanin
MKLSEKAIRRGLWLAAVCGVYSGLVACGGGGGGSSTTAATTGDETSSSSGDPTGTGGSGTAGGTASTGTGGTGGGTGGTATSGSNGGGGTMTVSSSGTGTSTLVNGCDPATAEDLTAMASVQIDFPVAGLKYSPACFRVKAGATLSFVGNFMMHPLTPGVDGTFDGNSPIQVTDVTPAGGSADFVMKDPGTYGFYCNFHWSSGMQGAVFVE